MVLEAASNYRDDNNDGNNPAKLGYKSKQKIEIARDSRRKTFNLMDNTKAKWIGERKIGVRFAGPGNVWNMEHTFDN